MAHMPRGWSEAWNACSRRCPGSAASVPLQIAERTMVLGPIPEDRFLCGFSHIFAGGYAAGYFRCAAFQASADGVHESQRRGAVPWGGPCEGVACSPALVVPGHGSRTRRSPHTHTAPRHTSPPSLKNPCSYKWAEVLSADAFAAFEDAGLDDDGAVQATGRRFAETVLALGGGRAPDLVFQVH